MQSMRALHFPEFAAAFAALILVFGFGVSAQAQTADTDLLAARDAYRAGDAARLDRVAPRLKGHLLEQYVSYWQIKLKLDDAEVERVKAFLARYAGTPLGDRLRGEWLKSLAKREQWALFAAEYPKRAGDDSELDCYAIQWKRARDGDTVLGDARRYWTSGQDQPESCQTLFAALLKAGQLTPADLWVRFRLAHEARNAQQVLSKNEYRPTSVMGRELTLYALDRAARADPAAAHEAWAKLRDRFSVEDRSYGNLLVAHQGARQL